MPIDVKAIKSAQLVSDESEIMSLITQKHAAWRETNPMRANADPGHTVVLFDGAHPMISKRSDIGVIEAALPEVEKLKELATSKGFEWDDATSPERVVRYWASDSRGDRHGDVVDQSWKFDEFQDNPIMLFSHEWGEPPIGGILDWDVMQRQTRNYGGEALSLLSLFAHEVTSSKADGIYRLVKAGFLKAGSVGFFPEQVIEVKNKDERQKLGLADHGLLFCNNRLIEWSPCSVPANPGAHRTLHAAKSVGMLHADDMQIVRELRRQESLLRNGGDSWKKDDALLVGMAKSLFPDVMFPDHRDVESPITESVKASGGMVSLSDVADMISMMKSDIGDALETIQSKQEDLEFAMQQLGSAKREDEETSASDDDSVAADVVGAAALLSMQDR